jgi:CRISPR/Cas system CMR subunit Cmr6 (Cas7 group RAMP superfamily)
MRRATARPSIKSANRSLTKNSLKRKGVFKQRSRNVLDNDRRFTEVITSRWEKVTRRLNENTKAFVKTYLLTNDSFCIRLVNKTSLFLLLLL